LGLLHTGRDGNILHMRRVTTAWKVAEQLPVSEMDSAAQRDCEAGMCI